MTPTQINKGQLEAFGREEEDKENAECNWSVDIDEESNLLRSISPSKRVFSLKKRIESH